MSTLKRWATLSFLKSGDSISGMCAPYFGYSTRTYPSPTQAKGTTQPLPQLRSRVPQPCTPLRKAMLSSSSTVQSSRHSFASICAPQRLWCSQLCRTRGVRYLLTTSAELASNMPRNASGERDATQAEKVSGFAEKPLGFYDTSHIIRGPDGLIRLVGLSAKRCRKDAKLLAEEEVNKLRNQTPGWRLNFNDKGQPYLRQDWKVKDFQSGLQLFERMALIAEEENHHPDLHLQGYNNVAAELSTHSLGGLTENDFIIAARINAINFRDLLPKPKRRFWA